MPLDCSPVLNAVPANAEVAEEKTNVAAKTFVRFVISIQSLYKLKGRYVGEMPATIRPYPDPYLAIKVWQQNIEILEKCGSGSLRTDCTLHPPYGFTLAPASLTDYVAGKIAQRSRYIRIRFCIVWKDRGLGIGCGRKRNGVNNGAIHLSHSDAAAALAVHRNTVGPWFKMLEARGFIFLTCAPHLGPSGIGKASVWGLAEEATPDGRPARKTFMYLKCPVQCIKRAKPVGSASDD
jgi:hypothetical protein